MYQGKIREGKMSVMRKPGDINETIIFLEQQHGKISEQKNKVFIFHINDITYFLSKDENFPNLLAEMLSLFTQQSN